MAVVQLVIAPVERDAVESPKEAMKVLAEDGRELPDELLGAMAGGASDSDERCPAFEALHDQEVEENAPKATTTVADYADGYVEMLGDSMVLEQSTLSIYGYLLKHVRSGIGEICGLTWADVSLETRTVWVRRTIARHDGKYYLKKPKTRGSIGRRPSTTVFDDALAKRPITESGALEDILPSISGPGSLSRP